MVRLALLRRFGGGMPAQCRGGGSSAGSLPWLQHVPRTAAADPDCADLLETTRQQRLAGQARDSRCSS